MMTVNWLKTLIVFPVLHVELIVPVIFCASVAKEPGENLAAEGGGGPGEAND